MVDKKTNLVSLQEYAERCFKKSDNPLLPALAYLTALARLQSGVSLRERPVGRVQLSVRSRPTPQTHMGDLLGTRTQPIDSWRPIMFVQNDEYYQSLKRFMIDALSRGLDGIYAPMFDNMVFTTSMPNRKNIIIRPTALGIPKELTPI
jgi:hypothetical protein